MSEFSRDKHHEFGFPYDMEVMPYFLGFIGADYRPLSARLQALLFSLSHRH